MNHIAPRPEPLIREIPLSRLSLAPENVRKTSADQAVAQTSRADPRRPPIFRQRPWASQKQVRRD